MLTRGTGRSCWVEETTNRDLQKGRKLLDLFGRGKPFATFPAAARGFRNVQLCGNSLERPSVLVAPLPQRFTQEIRWQRSPFLFVVHRGRIFSTLADDHGKKRGANSTHPHERHREAPWREARQAAPLWGATSVGPLLKFAVFS